MNASLPYMYGLIKTHKEGNPVRPIISSVGSVTYSLSKWLVELLNPLLGSISESHIKNSTDLIDKLNKIPYHYNKFKLISFDVCSLFTKVPVNDLINFLSNELNIKPLPFNTHKIIRLIKLCTLNNKFVFNDVFYEQCFGMAMGGPLSPLLANIYMEFFERDILSRVLPKDVIWYRYISL